MLSYETASLIVGAYRDIEDAEKLLTDMRTIREREGLGPDEPTLTDVLGQRRHMQIGIPLSNNGHRMLDISPMMAEYVIRSHIEGKRAEMAELQVRAWAELMREPPATDA